MQRFVLIALSAALYTAAFPPWGFASLAFVALVPLLVALRQTTIATAACSGMLWGTLTIWGIGYWVPVSMSTYWGQPLWFGVLFSLITSAIFMGLYGAGFATTAALIARRTGGLERVLALACAWVAWELARARWLTGDPWLLLGYALGRYSHLSQIADLGAVYCVSFVAAVVNFSLTSALLDRRLTASATAALLLLATWAYGDYRLRQAVPQQPEHRVRLVQAANDPGAQWLPAHYGEGLDRYLSLSAKDAGAARPELLIWPESAVTFFLAREPHYEQLIRDRLRELATDLLLGAPHFSARDPAMPEYFNSAFYLDADGVRGRYDKVHLMPFGEYFPLRTIQFLRRNFERVRSFTPGTAAPPLDTAIGRVAVVICFEAIFPELVRERMVDGAEILINLSNDAWLGDNAGPRQHALMVAMRAIETRSWVIRATTTGVSSIVDPWGRVVAQTALGVPAVLDGSVVPLAIDTLYERTGDLFAFACALIAALTAARALI